MRLYKTTITPISSFATPLKGDTLFGQICWAIRYIYKEDRLNSLLQNYDTEPFLIVSDGFASGYLPKPTLPSALLNESLKDKIKNSVVIEPNIKSEIRMIDELNLSSSNQKIRDGLRLKERVNITISEE